jgi:hypothetical protein
METVLYRAPFWNVSDDGGVCMPSGIREKFRSKNGVDNISIATAKNLEEIFCAAGFSHSNAHSPIATLGHDLLWITSTKHPQDKFSNFNLIKTDKKLKDIISK